MSWRQWKEKGKGKGPAVEDSWTVSLSMSSQKGWFMAKARYSEKVSLILERREVWTSLWLTASSFFFFSSMLHTEMLEVDSTKMLRHGSYRSESTQCFRYAPNCWNPNTIFFLWRAARCSLELAGITALPLPLPSLSCPCWMNIVTHPVTGNPYQHAQFNGLVIF